MTTTTELHAEAQRLSSQLERTIPALTENVRVAAETEANYRKAKAVAYAKAALMPELKLAGERAAWVDAETADLRQARDIAEGLRAGQIELIRNLRQQMSLLQTLANAHKEDQAFYRTGQQHTPPEPDAPPHVTDEEIPF